MRADERKATSDLEFVIDIASLMEHICSAMRLPSA